MILVILKLGDRRSACAIFPVKCLSFSSTRKSGVFCIVYSYENSVKFTYAVRKTVYDKFDVLVLVVNYKSKKLFNNYNGTSKVYVRY